MIHAQSTTRAGLTACGIDTDTLPATVLRVHLDGATCPACRGVEPDTGADLGAVLAVALALLGLVVIAAG